MTRLVSALRYLVCGWLYSLAYRVNPAPSLEPERGARIWTRIQRQFIRDQRRNGHRPTTRSENR